MTSDYGYDQLKTHRAQAAHARLAAEARETLRDAARHGRTHRTARLHLRGVWFPGRPVNLPG
jgi:hypothetical protein